MEIETKEGYDARLEWEKENYTPKYGYAQFRSDAGQMWYEQRQIPLAPALSVGTVTDTSIEVLCEELQGFDRGAFYYYEA